MVRPVSEIKAEMEALRNKGVHHRSREMRALSEELKEAEGLEAGASSPPAAPEPMASPLEGGVNFAPPPVEPASSPFDSDEWRFIEKCCAELEVEFRSGQLTGVVKKLYNVLDAKIKVWRIAREIVREIGIGNEWPQWAVLNRDESTGRKEAPKPLPVAPAPSPTMAPKVSEGGMPVRSRRPSADEILAAVTGGDPRSGVLAEVGSRARNGSTEV